MVSYFFHVLTCFLCWIFFETVVTHFIVRDPFLYVLAFKELYYLYYVLFVTRLECFPKKCKAYSNCPIRRLSWTTFSLIFALYTVSQVLRLVSTWIDQELLVKASLCECLTSNEPFPLRLRLFLVSSWLVNEYYNDVGFQIVVLSCILKNCIVTWTLSKMNTKHMYIYKYIV